MVNVPPKQPNYQQALDAAFEAARSQTAEGLAALGARSLGGGRCELDVLEDVFTVDLAAGTVTVSGAEAPPDWRILSLHYLAAFQPCPPFTRWLSFSDIPEIRGYKPVFDKRVIGRLCATAGRDRGTFVAASAAVGGRRFEWGDEGFEFRAFPRLAVGIAWYAGDEELPPGASFVYPDNVTAFLPIEDVVVLAEAIVARLQRAAGALR